MAKKGIQQSNRDKKDRKPKRRKSWPEGHPFLSALAITVIGGVIPGVLLDINLAAAIPLPWHEEQSAPFEVILAGGDSSADPIAVDDDIVLYLNGEYLTESVDNVSSRVDSIRFQVRNGDKLRIEALDSRGVCRVLGPLALYRVSDGASQPLTPGYPLACDDATAGKVFWTETFTVDLL